MNSPSSCAPLRRRLWARPEVGCERRRKRNPRPTAHPSDAASGPGPKLAAGEVVRNISVQLRAPPLRVRAARPKLGGERRRKQTPRPAACPSDALSRPGPKSAAKGVESKLIQTNTYLCSAPVQQRWRSAAAVGAPPVSLLPGQVAWRGAPERRVSGHFFPWLFFLFYSCVGQAQSVT